MPAVYPCSVCGSYDLTFKKVAEFGYVVCKKCGKQSSTSITESDINIEDKIIKQWNSENTKHKASRQ